MAVDDQSRTGSKDRRRAYAASPERDEPHSTISVYADVTSTRQDRNRASTRTRPGAGCLRSCPIVALISSRAAIGAQPVIDLLEGVRAIIPAVHRGIAWLSPTRLRLMYPHALPCARSVPRSTAEVVEVDVAAAEDAHDLRIRLRLHEAVEERCDSRCGGSLDNELRT